MPEYDKIKNWDYLGKLVILSQTYGKASNSYRCPICRADLIIYRRKGTYKIKCVKCPYVRYSKKIVEGLPKECYNLLISHDGELKIHHYEGGETKW